MMKMKLCGLTAGEIFEIIGKYGYTETHSVSIANAIYKKRVSDISHIQKVPKKLKIDLESHTVIGNLVPVASEVSVDTTVKYLFRTETGKEFETVYIPDIKRKTVCVSTQSGCRMGCSICATGRYGFHGNLTAGEIVSQVTGIPDALGVTHVVFMGMGEPMDNLDSVLKACKILTADWGLALSPRNITVSTVGLTPGIETFLECSACNLTLSLHSPYPDEREKLVPAEKKYPVKEIIRLMKNYPQKKKRRLTIAYVMVKDLNDTDMHLEGIKELLRDSKLRVNLLPYHRVHYDKYMSSSDDRMQSFKHNLVISGISASIRKSRGIDISAACGLLAAGVKAQK
jgi:23S rRNA (adenine2503-C2)-methyltransferase